MKTISQVAKENNFKVTNVSRTEFEDGIGAQIGLNFVKNEVFYTDAELAKELGYELKFTSGNFQAKTAQDAVRQLEAALKTANVVAYELTRKPNEYKRGEWFVSVSYIK